VGANDYFPHSSKGNKQLSHSTETALQGGLVMAKSGRLELEDNILRTL